MSIEKKNITFRFSLIIILAFFIGVAILFKASITVFIERDGWLKKVANLKVEDKRIDPKRGNIFAEDGRLMASSIPQYYAYIDFKADGLKKDTLTKYLPELSKALSSLIGDMSAASYQNHIMRGYHKQTRNFQLIKRKISYTEMKELKRMPFLKQPSHRSGLILTAMAQRKKPFGLLASRTIGDVYGDQAMGGKNGLELAFDSLLTGTPGVGTRQKVYGKYITITETEPVDGVDITTTIDINIQDIAEKALMDKLVEIDAASGTAVVMEVKTGAVKAIANLGRVSEGVYQETKNFAVADESEPGSTFKVASMMVALEKGIVEPEDTIDTGNGIYMYKGARMTDHNWNKGGYGKITAAQSIWYSSNIGVAKTVLKGFEQNPGEFVNGLYEMSLHRKLEMNIPGAGRPKIRHPQDTARFWSKTSLPWMSFGYETQIPPIYTLNFFNAIANGGKMMKPYFVKNISKDGKTIETMDPEVVNSKICSSSTLDKIRQMLLDVVEQEKGTAHVIKSDRLLLAGKTGTAQISQGKMGYTAGGKSHQVSFCGYFPADKPVYSCIVVIRGPRRGYPSGGGMSGMVFKNIAERTYAQSRFLPVEENRDTAAVLVPRIKNGDYRAIRRTLDELDISFEDDNKDWTWTVTKLENKEISMRELSTPENLVPSVHGMGAKDAVFLLENSGLRVHINGIGKVYSQSKPAGQRFSKGETIVLNLR